MKWLIRIFVILVLTLVLSSLSLGISTNLISVLYTVIGIMFSVSMSLQMSFSFSEVESEKYIKEKRNELAGIRKVYIGLFCVSTVLFLIPKPMVLFSIGVIQMEATTLACVFMLYCMISYIVNFSNLSRLRDEIEDEVRKMLQQKRDNKTLKSL